MTKEPQEETYQTLENKALEEFDERFYLPFHTPTEKKKEMVEYIKKVSKYVGGDTKLLTTRENVIDFLKSHLQLAFKAGEEKGYDKGKDDNNKIIVEEDKPTKECKHEELLGDDYTEDCSVKLFGYRDKKGVTHITREEISNPKIDSILKEADKEFDEKFNFSVNCEHCWGDVVDVPCRCGDDIREKKKGKDVKDFLHSQITKAYKAGQEDMEARLKHLY